MGVAVVLALSLAAPLALAGEPDADALIKEFSGQAEAKKRSAQELQAAYATVLDALVPQIQGENPADRKQPEQTLEWICWRAGRPGAETERAAVCEAMARRLGREIPTAARVWLTKQLLHVGRGDAVEALAGQLDHDDARVREWTRRALQNNPSPRSAAPLRQALAKTESPEGKVALLNALAHKPGKKTVQAVLPHGRDANDEVRAAAVRTLARMGDPSAADVIAAATTRGSERAKAIAVDSYLALADRLAEAGDKTRALAIYRKLLDREGHVRCAAIIGVGRAGGVDELPVIFKALASKDARERGAGLTALELLPPDAVLEAVEDKLKAAPPEMKVALLRALGRRTDKAILPAFLAAAKDASKQVRVAAYEGLGRLEDPKAADVLIAALLKAEGDERSVVAQTINRIPGQAMTDALIDALGRADAEARVQIVRCLALREGKRVAPTLLRLAEKDADASVRSQAFKALTGIADPAALPQLVTLLVGAKERKDRSAAEKAVVAVARRLEDPAQRTKPVLAALDGAGPQARCSLLRVAARLGGSEALGALREARQSNHDEVQDTAIRELARWDSPEVADDLLDLARHAESLAHKVVALDGYVRVIGLMGGRPAAELLKMYEDAMAAAPRPQDRKRVLSGMAQVANLGALRMAQQCLDDPKLRAEAEVAVVSIARAICGSHTAEARRALAQILKDTASPQRRKQAKQAYALADKIGDYLVSWQVAGPYGSNGPGDFNKPFAPEKEGETAAWKTMTVGTTPDKPWLIEPDHVGWLRGSNRVAYFRTRIYSPKQQKARMELGSDDGVKVWIGGNVVHAHNVTRPCSPGQDKKTVTLPEGWSDLMVKLTQGGGEWAFCLRFRAPDGGSLDGLKAEVGGGN
ncbi:MAG: HEAT repeat domain-containing protein [Planctomycetota bacterium]